MSKKSPRAEVYRSTARAAGNKRISGFRFRLKGANGKIIAAGELYKKKDDIFKLLAFHFANFDVVDKTVGKKNAKGTGKDRKRP